MKQWGRAAPVRAAQVILAAATLLVAALLIFECAHIYITGTSAQNRSETGVYLHDVYSRELVAQRLSRIAWAFLLWLAALVAVPVTRALWPDQPGKAALLPVENRLALMRERVADTPEMLLEQSKRKRAALLCAAVCACCAVPVCLYLLRGDHFASRDLEGVMGAMLLHVAPWIVAAFAALAVFAQVRENSLQRELAAAKQAPKRKPEPQGPRSSPWKPALRIVLGAAALALLALGVQNGGMYDVLVKAINICTECIGLG